MVPKKEMEEKKNLDDECDNYPQDEEQKKIDDTRSEDPAQLIKTDRIVYPESAELDSRRLDTSLNPASGLELVLIPRASDYLVAAGAAQRCHSVGALPLRSVPVYLSGATSDPGVSQERRGGSPPLDINTGSENPERIEGFALCDGATFSVEDTPTPVYSVRKSTPTLTCTYCGLSGHDARRCWDNPQSTKCRRKYEQRGSPTPWLPPGTSPSEHRPTTAYQRTCFECGQSNHLRKQCDRLDTNLRAPNAGSAIRNPGSEPAPIALRAYSRTTSREGLSTATSNGSSANRTSCRLTAVLGLTTRVGFHSRPRPPYQGHDKESLCSEGNLDMGHQYTHARAHADTPPTSSIHDMEMPMDSPKLRPTLVVHETPLLAAAVDGHRLERETRSPFPPPLLIAAGAAAHSDGRQKCSQSQSSKERAPSSVPRVSRETSTKLKTIRSLDVALQQPGERKLPTVNPGSTTEDVPPNGITYTRQELINILLVQLKPVDTITAKTSEVQPQKPMMADPSVIKRTRLPKRLLRALRRKLSKDRDVIVTSTKERKDTENERLELQKEIHSLRQEFAKMQLQSTINTAEQAKTIKGLEAQVFELRVQQEEMTTRLRTELHNVGILIGPLTNGLERIEAKLAEVTKGTEGGANVQTPQVIDIDTPRNNGETISNAITRQQPAAEAEQTTKASANRPTLSEVADSSDKSSFQNFSTQPLDAPGLECLQQLKDLSNKLQTIHTHQEMCAAASLWNETFEGKRDEDINRFMKSFEVYCRLGNVPQENWSLQLWLRLEGYAQQLVEDIDTGIEGSYALMRKRLLDTFGSSDQSHTAIAAIEDLRYAENTGVNDLAGRLLILLRKAYPNDSNEVREARAFDIIKAKLPREIKLEMIRCKAKNLQDLIKGAPVAEALMRESRQLADGYPRKEAQPVMATYLTTEGYTDQTNVGLSGIGRYAQDVQRLPAGEIPYAAVPNRTDPNDYLPQQPSRLATIDYEQGYDDPDDYCQEQDEQLPQETVVCAYCGQQGHFMMYCQVYQEDRECAGSQTNAPDRMSSSRQRRQRPVCEYCGRIGHAQSTCRDYQRDLDQSSQDYTRSDQSVQQRRAFQNMGSNKPPVTCYACGQIGHIMRDCAYLAQVQQQQLRQQQPMAQLTNQLGQLTIQQPQYTNTIQTTSQQELLSLPQRSVSAPMTYQPPAYPQQVQMQHQQMQQGYGQPPGTNLSGRLLGGSNAAAKH